MTKHDYIDEIIPPEVVKFLKTKEGRLFFKEITKTKDRRLLCERRKSFLNPPKNVCKWMNTLCKINKHID